MTIRTDKIEITAEDYLLDAGYYAIAKHHGWSETIFDKDMQEINNPISAKEFSLLVTKKFWRDSIANYNSIVESEKAKQLAKEQAEQVLNTFTIKIAEE